jgi:hypothetical protein
MKPYNEQEFNNLCAEFLGYVNTTATDPDFNIFENEKGMIIGNKIHTMLETMSMKFHSDWNWIMEVWEKIKLIPNFEDWYINLKLSSMRNMICGKFSIVDPKEAVIQAIWQFLTWYNGQK